MPIYAFGDARPRVHPTAYVHPDAVLIGHVTIGADASVWPTAVLRGDFGQITVGDRTSVQDGTIVHTTAEDPTIIGSNCVVGHNAHLEGCTVEDGCLIGSMSVVLNGARISTGSLVAGGALVPYGVHVPAGSRALGVPARVQPNTDPKFGEWMTHATATYVQAANLYRDNLVEVDPNDSRGR